ncbi:MAG TPA: helix-turn-helix domain-containing protein [Chitinophagaceae bacterium]|nr:TetR/AcrR family transcriptional regulator [Chitinophagaceae bacterium]MCB9056627.1 TetR/AcrR family transcriptional regulator [Chitinophagales bacterium]HPG10672.1 helix-turn-helix domain-containing protein [Chitinophagaceae bacterium]HRX93039.1 helix-turn-helix domain-containing protein [Chitinophagaceae bacterium]
MSPRTQDQLQQLRETRKQHILEAALKVFAAHGYDGATINMIAKEAGIAKGLMYTYYESKEKLVEELIRFGLKKAASFMQEKPFHHLTTRKAFEESLRHMIDLFLQETDFWRLYTMLALQPNLASKFKKESMAFVEQYLGIYIAYFQKRKSKDPMAEAMLLGTIIDGLMFDLLIAPAEYPLDDVIKMVVKKFA